jgi:hypothetical protein
VKVTDPVQNSLEKIAERRFLAIAAPNTGTTAIGVGHRVTHVCQVIELAGATGLEPATSSVTDDFECIATHFRAVHPCG